MNKFIFFISDDNTISMNIFENHVQNTKELFFLKDGIYDKSN
jgi:hypothetical protein